MPRLPDVFITVQDGLLNMLAYAASAIHAKVGVCSAGTVNQVEEIKDDGQIVSKFGTGPLTNALFDSFLAGSRTVFAVRANGDVAGVIGAVTATKTGQGNMTTAGTPLDSYDVIVEIVSSGAKNVATFKYSLDGGDTYSGIITVPTALTYEITGTGITLNFSEYATDPPQSFLAGDKYTFKTTAPKASVASVGAAIDALLAYAKQYEFIHVVGDSDSAMWTALDTKATDAENAFRYIHFLTEARGQNTGETVDVWQAALVTEKGSFASVRVAICAARVEIDDMNTGRRVDRNAAGIIAGRLSAISPGVSAGRVSDGPLPSRIVRLNPVGIKESHILALDQAGFITMRQYIGLTGFYITNYRMSKTDSDFKYGELRRPMDKACTLVRAAALIFEQVQADESGLVALEEHLSAPLDDMAGAGDIAKGRVVIPRNQDIVGTSKIQAKIRMVPLGIMREIELDIGFENPVQGGAS